MLSCLFLLSILSCGKYEDGPMFSLLSKKHRLCTKWGGQQDGILGYVEYPHQLEFHRDGGFTERNRSLFLFGETFEGGEIYGTWEFTSNKEVVTIQFDSGETFDLSINRLTRNDFWFEFTRDDNALTLVELPRFRD